MRVSSISIIEHPEMPKNEARVVFDRNVTHFPPHMRDDVRAPYILTGNLALTQGMLTLMVAQTLSEYLDEREAS